MNVDILICSVPSGVLQRPAAAPALLKACCQQAGFSARTRDLSLDLFINQCHRDVELYREISHQFETLTVFDPNDPMISKWLSEAIETIKGYDPKYLGISVFTNYQHRATVLLCRKVREVFPDMVIIVGGMGLDYTTAESFRNFPGTDGIDRINNFHFYLRKHNLADHIILGTSGETDLVNVLKNTQSNDDTEIYSIPAPDFDDYLMDQYLWRDEKRLTVTGSKGCVRACKFCNVPGQFGRFRRRDGEQVADEMIALKEKYNIRNFEFTDSLVNGSQKDFLAMLEKLSAYNDPRQKEDQITWFGQYITRPQSQIKPGTYDLMKRGGASNLVIGVESGSNAVLAHMDKKITVEDVFDEFEQFQKHGLTACMLIMTGYVNETKERFHETLRFIFECRKYTASGTLRFISPGLPLYVNPGTPLHDRAEELGILLNHGERAYWRVRDDPDNTYAERVYRRIVLQQLLNAMGMDFTLNHVYEINLLLQTIKDYEKTLIDPLAARDHISVDLPHH